MGKFYWTPRDWKWVVIILFGIIIALLTTKLGNNKELISYFSFATSLTSISLALIAIGISLIQNTSFQELYSRMNETLAKVDEKIHNVDDKISDIDIEKITETLRQSMKEFGDEIIQTIEEIADPETSRRFKEILPRKIEQKINDTNKRLRKK
ncbi:MAG: hypothetical protein PWQ96_428 [Clostridia bacterium]|nr:hypothetical protein [Clostridia bacterium]